MKGPICVATLAALIAAPAVAADMAVKAPPPAPAPAYSWTGWYVGGNAGASFGHAKTDFNAAPATVNTTFGSFDTPGLAGSAITEPAGVIGGGQIGYNWQFSPILVAGLEADIQASGERDSITLTGPFSFTGVGQPVTGTTVIDYQTKIDWFGTVRGRIGYLFGDGAVMTYVTGGLAYGKVDLNGTSTASGSIFRFTNIPFSITHAIGHSQVNTGWTLGSGTEGKLLIPGWTYKIEYLYVDLGSLDDTDAPALIVNSVTGGRTFTHTHFTDNVIRLGLNYQFH